MIEITVDDSCLRQAAAEDMDSFVNVFVDAINNGIGGELTADTMAQLNTDQITLLAYKTLQSEVMDGGFIQLIHNGYGGFIFRNPFAKMMRMWGLPELASLINRAHKAYNKYREEIEREYSDEEFMTLFEKYPVFDNFDDIFVENEEQWTSDVARYIDEHIDNFVTIRANE